ncbi:MAG: CHC2 zinc finger domain-containing protein [Actinomycetota bacterium]|nr:CHC2 zinc finger domain-containing protein [Actinomycetota bacterium]
MSGYDRDEVLAHTDLAALAAELCGPPRGQGAGAKWHCPNPDHPDAHPSMSVFTGQRSQRWKCHACGDGGTAIDLWMTVNKCGVAEAIEDLGARTHLPRDLTPWSPSDGTGRPGRRPDRAPAQRGARPNATPHAVVSTVPVSAVDPAVEAYVATAAELLWGPSGEPGRSWLRGRGFSDEVLRANRVGYDPGPRSFHRPRGLPRHGPGVVYPVLGPDGAAVYLQTRYLDPIAAGRDKYDNPWSGFARNPRVAMVRTPSANGAFEDLVVVTEGIPDGLVVAQTGARVAAVIGAGNHGPDVAPRISEAFPTGRFAIVWDADWGGRHGASLLGVRLVELGRDVVLSSPPRGFNDVNDWWRAQPAGLPAALASVRRSPLYRPGIAAGADMAAQEACGLST